MWMNLFVSLSQQRLTWFDVVGKESAAVFATVNNFNDGD